MSESNWSRVRELFAAALDRPDGERDAFLVDACGADRELLERVQRLLAADTEDEGAVSIDETTAGFRSQPAFDYVGRRIGDYEVLRGLGRGGMGIVFAASQGRPRRTVALKMMSSPLVTEVEQARFEFEIESLGKLQHPAIAQVFDAGAWLDPATGRTLPWFAMELVADARPVDRFAQDAGLSVVDRVELVATVAAAMRHGHARGVLHRDLKPDNILVDGSGRPKVIDFGTARSTDPSGQRYTMTGMMLGTPAYMSPEQFDGDPAEIDAQTDVYALGVVLYELLTDRLPHEPGAESVTQFAARVRRDTPTRPSACRTGIAATGVGDDLDWICLTALANDRSERYATIAQLEDDLRRYVRGEPVLAGPPSKLRSMRRLVRTHRALVLGTAAVLVVLVAGIITTTWWRFEAEEQRGEAVTQKTKAERQTKRAETINEYYQEILKLGDPSEGKYESRHDWTVREAIEATSAWVDKLEAEPDIEASVRVIAGESLVNFRKYELARPHLERAIALLQATGEASDDLERAYSCLAKIENRKGDEAAALALYRKGLAVCIELYGERHRQVAISMLNIGSMLKDLGQPEESIRTIRAAREMFASLPEDNVRFVAVCFLHEAFHCESTEDFAGARDLYQRAIRTFEAAQKQSHPLAGSSHQLLGRLLRRRLGKPEAALVPLRRAAAIFDRALGPESLEAGRSQVYILNALRDLNRLDEREAHVERADRAYTATLPATSKARLSIRRNLAMERFTRGDFTTARNHLAGVVARLDGSEVAAKAARDYRCEYADALRACGDLAAARRVLERVRKDTKAGTGFDLRLRLQLVRLDIREGKVAAAQAELAAVAAVVPKLSAKSLTRAVHHLTLGDLHVAASRFDAARAEFDAALQLLTERLGARHDYTITWGHLALVALGQVADQPELVARHRRQLRPSRSK